MGKGEEKMENEEDKRNEEAEASKLVNADKEGEKIVNELKILVERKKEAAKPKACRKI